MEQAVIVLTADESMMSEFRDFLYNGYAACFPTHLLTESAFKAFCPPVECYPDGRAKLAPLPLRLLESILRRSGFRQGEYATIHPKYLDSFIGPKTRVVGVSTIDPQGLGSITKTLCSLHGGVPYSKELFTNMLRRIKLLKERHSFKVIAGGPGAWQLASEGLLDELGIDHLVIGEAENVVPRLFAEIASGGATRLPRLVTGEAPEAKDIPSIVGATTNGLIEVSRGCGRGCAYCTSAISGAMRCIPIETVKESVEVNVRGEVADIALQSDDALLYGSNSRKFVPDQDSVLTLLNELCSIRGVKTVSFLHFTFASILASPGIVRKVTDFLKNRGRGRFEVQMGIETGSPRLVRRHMCGKTLPFSPEEWPEVVVKAAHILRENGWFCHATLMLGLPGETVDDVVETTELVRRLRGSPMVITPLFFSPSECTSLRACESFSREDMSTEHHLLLHEIGKHNEKMASFNREAGFINSYLLHSRSHEQHSASNNQTRANRPISDNISRVKGSAFAYERKT